MKLYYIEVVEDCECDECGYNGGRYANTEKVYKTLKEAEEVAKYTEEHSVVFEICTDTMEISFVSEFDEYEHIGTKFDITETGEKQYKMF